MLPLAGSFGSKSIVASNSLNRPFIREPCCTKLNLTELASSETVQPVAPPAEAVPNASAPTHKATTPPKCRILLIRLTLEASLEWFPLYRPPPVRQRRIRAAIQRPFSGRVCERVVSAPPSPLPVFTRGPGSPRRMRLEKGGRSARRDERVCST